MARSHEGGVNGRLALALLVSAIFHVLLLVQQHVAAPSGAAVPSMLNVRLMTTPSPQASGETASIPEAVATTDMATEAPTPSVSADRPEQSSSNSGESGIAQRPDKQSMLYYFTAADLHQRPIPLRRMELSSLQEKFPGRRAELTLRINETGQVDDLKIEADTPDFAQAVRDFMANLSFVPGKISDRAVKSEIKLEIRLPGSP